MNNFASHGWFKDEFHKRYAESAKEIGRFNLALFGKTGVGKSTLVNAVFGAEVAKTGIGEPVTRESTLYLHTSGFFGLLDTQGLEIGVEGDRVIKDLAKVIQERRRRPPAEQIHVAWYAIRFADRRFEETEAEFVRKLADLGLPVVLVMTQVPTSPTGDYHPDAVEFAQQIDERALPVYGSRVYLTNAKADDFSGQQVHGLQALVDATFRCAPEGVQDALTAAQKVDVKRKQEQANAVIAGAATAAGAAGVTPIPFSDAVVLVPIQLGMMARISAIFGIEVDKAAMASIAATAAATQAGRSVAGNLLKFVPGFGAVGGGAINATVAAGFTVAIGAAWSTVCVKLAEGKLRGVNGALDTESIRSLFLDELKNQIAKMRLNAKNQ
ncbi:GTPase family protein [Nocardioides albertanoniae]|uniref:GTPase family protein n=1 Tax=Nocardioides albertanoniae TaxID=1175486 RepID=UPI001FE3AC54|nr:GTPase [Nocardioides albertanoniae]